MKIFAVGDIHGSHKALVQCLERSRFDRERDRLISLGDVCDFNLDVKACIDELLKLKHFDLVLGNHDLWAIEWAVFGRKKMEWVTQGGQETIRSYKNGPMPEAHINFLMTGKPFLKLDNKIFVHGGFDPAQPIEKQDQEFLAWDRELLADAAYKHQTEPQYRFGSYDEIFIGHTPTQLYGSDQPLHYCNLWDIDTGVRHSAKLTIMNVETHEYWQSDPVSELYGK